MNHSIYRWGQQRCSVTILPSLRFTDSAKKILSTYQELVFDMYGVASVIVTAILLPLLGFVAVCLRFYTRIRLTSTFVGTDDWLIAFSCLLVLGHGAAQVVGMILKPPPPDQNESIE